MLNFIFQRKIAACEYVYFPYNYMASCEVKYLYTSFGGFFDSLKILSFDE